MTIFDVYDDVDAAVASFDRLPVKQRSVAGTPS